MRLHLRVLYLASLLPLLLLLAAPASAAGGLRAAGCRRDITPVSPGLAAAYEERFGTPATVNHTDPVFMAGFGNGREASDYHDRLWARGVVLEGRGGRVAIVALDLVGYFVNEVDTIRALLAPATAIDYLVVHSTHQHEGPDTLGLWGASELTTGIDFGYLDFINDAVADCLDEAASQLRKARIRYATTDSLGLSLGLDAEDDGFGVADGKVLVGDELLAPETEGRFVDSRLVALQITGRRKPFTPLVTLVNFGSHPESLGASNTVITSDYPHFLRQRIEAEYGGLAIFVSGALGVLAGPLDIDVLDPQTAAPAPRRSFRFAEVHGAQLAERVIEAFAATEEVAAGGGKSKKAKRKEAKSKKGKIKKAKSKKGKGKSAARPGDPNPEIRFASEKPVAIRLDNPYFRFLGLVGALSPRRQLFSDGLPDDAAGDFRGVPGLLGEDLHTEVGAMRIGDASFALHPGELDPQIGERYRELMRGARHTFIFNLANDEIGYQVPFDKWDDSCHSCGPFVLNGAADLCPVQPVDCGTIFINNAGQQVDPSVSGAMIPLLEALH